MRLLRGVAGRVLPCGCLVGVYETYEGVVVTTVDCRGPHCTDSSHQLHRELSSQDQPPRPAVISRN